MLTPSLLSIKWLGPVYTPATSYILFERESWIMKINIRPPSEFLALSIFLFGSGSLCSYLLWLGSAQALLA